MAKAIVIRIEPEHAEGLRDLWKQMKKRKLTGYKKLRDAVYGELLNLQMRWMDAIGEDDECRKNEEYRKK